jgi:hypothetical protein
MKSKATVPDAMLNAFKSGRGHQNYGDFSEDYRKGLESVLHWLEATLELKCLPNNTHWQAGYNSALRDVLSIFYINPVVDAAKRTVMGTTLTRAEADEIIEFVSRCIAPEKEKSA